MTEGPRPEYAGQDPGDSGQPEAGSIPPVAQPSPWYDTPPGREAAPSYGAPPGYGAPGYGAYGGYRRPPAPKPGIIPLRPLGVGEILDGAFTAMRWNPKAILIPSAIVSAVTGVLLAVATYLMGRGLLANINVSPQGGAALTAARATQPGVAAVAAIALFAAYGLVSFAGNAILTGFLTGVIGQAALGRKETLGSAWRATRSRIWPVIGALLLAVLFVGLGWAVTVGLSVGIGFAIGAGAHLIPLGVLLGVACGVTATVFAVMVTIRWSLIIPAVVLEGAGPIKGMGRSWRLVRGSWWRVFGILLLIQFIVTVAAELIRLPFAFGGGLGSILGSSGGSVSIAGVIISAIGSIISSAVTAPLLAGAVVLLYADLRMRREGMDITLQAAAAAGGQYPGSQYPGGRYPDGQYPGKQEPGTW